MHEKTSFTHSYFFFFLVAFSLKLYVFRLLQFEDFNPLNTIWYELCFIVILFAIVELFIKKGKFTVYIILDVLFTLLLFAMAVYGRYFHNIPTYHALAQVNQVGSVSGSIWLLLSFKDLYLLVDFVLLIIFHRIKSKRFFPQDRTFTKKSMLALGVVGLLISILNFSLHRDEVIRDQALFSKKYGVTNAQLIKANEDVLGTTNTNISKVTQEDIIKLKGNKPVPFEEHTYFDSVPDKNLLIIQLESFQDFVVDLKVNGQEITPNLNKLTKESMYFKNVFQQIGSGNTADAEFIMNASVYPVGEVPTSQKIEGKKVEHSLPRLLKEEGYFTSTFHADKVTYWNRDALYPALGFDAYFDSEYIGEKDIIGFGPSDKYFYNRTMKKLKEFQNTGKEPFYAHVLSLTSHSPFKMPKEKQMLDLPERYTDTLTGNYLQSVHYADQALGKFIQELKKSGLWDDSMIALYGDHSGVHGGLMEEEDNKLLKEILNEEYTMEDRFNIPFLIHVPGDKDKFIKEVDTVGGQLDMMPTILNLMGIKPKGLYFGQDILQYKNNLIGMRYYLPTGAFINNEHFFIPETSKEPVRVYDLKGKSLNLENPKQTFKSDYQNMLQLYDWSDAYFEELPMKEKK
ncbi:LTA synthase family protein [Virgibacillus halodenitrificans]|uniref:LTA synthase family protein n=1 Tax=Virgibacillus halodenitrificans TaxID=1482 RepID=UPI001FB3BAFA|nr:LTA synthase family protein [Virgibacillus halodenitrificans]MCJ0929612.1 LTA synthase family protein [Virgibacillus halodenitrificans]